MSDLLSYLPSLLSAAGAGDPLLDAIYGIGSSGGSSGQDPVQALTSAEQNQTQDVKVTAAQPDVQNAFKQFTQAVNGATSVTQLLNNPTVMNVLLTANGMSDQSGYTALATQALTSNLNDPSSLANRLTDTRWKTLAQTYNFASNGLSAIQNPAAIASIANKYAQATWQNSEDTVTPGLSNALSFKATASSITSVDQILGNPTMRTVVTTALGIPEQIAFQDISAQEQAISARVNISQFQDPKFVESFIEQYLIANNSTASSSTSSSPGLTSLAVQGQGILV